MYILPPSISKKIEGYRWQSFTPPAAGKSRRFRGLICHRRSQVAFSWDGHAIRTRPEGSVVFHEIAHWQNAPIERRHIYDLGLGAGPETGNVAAANAATCVDQTMKEEEENLASLLGILWEVEHDEPALMAFAEQNWLELYDRGNTHLHFVKSLDALRTRHLIDTTGHPLAASTFSFSP